MMENPHDTMGNSQNEAEAIPNMQSPANFRYQPEFSHTYQPQQSSLTHLLPSNQNFQQHVNPNYVSQSNTHPAFQLPADFNYNKNYVEPSTATPVTHDSVKGSWGLQESSAQLKSVSIDLPQEQSSTTGAELNDDDINSLLIAWELGILKHKFES